MCRLSHFLIPLPFLLAACGEDQLSNPSTSTSNSESVSAAAVLVVNSLADPGDGTCNTRECTLREAIKDSRSSTINFAPGLSGTITLARPSAGGGTLMINKSLSIVGPNIGITVRRRGTDPAFRLLIIDEQGVVSLTNLTLRNGRTDRPGGGISNFGALTLTRCTVEGNRTTQHGGGIDSHGPLTLNNSTVAQNSAGSGAGGIDNHLKTLKLLNSSVTDNVGEGIFNGAGRLQMTGGEVSRNAGGGIVQDWGRSSLNRIKIVGNSSSGISNHQGGVFLTNSSVVGNSSSAGAGIFNSAGGFISIVSSTINNNSATERGGGIFNTVGDPFGRLSADIEIINSTVSGNSAQSGGGIGNSDRLGGAVVRVKNSTITGNSAQSQGGGILNSSSIDEDNPNSVFLVNSIAARNTAPNSPDVAAGGARFSLIGDGTGSGISNTDGNQVGNVSPNSSRIDPKIGTLANNGGPTRTHALLAGSPAIDAASSADCPAKDQRGVARPQGAGCDIGSYEK